MTDVSQEAAREIFCYLRRVCYSQLVMPLHETYDQSNLHAQWRSVYRSHPLQSAFDEAVYHWLFSRIAARGSWLDAGCGSGERSVLIARQPAEVLAIDISSKILTVARQLAEREGVSMRFACHALEELPENIKMDNVHCRGVLMHIPDWRRALAKLCRCLKPGGYLVLFETNQVSFEAWLVRVVRKIQQRQAKMVVTDGGLEFWAERDGAPFLIRMSDLATLEYEMRLCGVERLFRRSVSLFDMNRFPPRLRPWVVRVNRAWFRLNLPFGSGVLVVGRKTQ